ncbi:MAG: trypsin-like peptidase domain-containing protein [Planctomycetaceae bacterium]|jgi:S1-C subfamily serine protease|nr:trypsin-like peptidase domain-containing protein [Planctomycetaceae bacterium]
MRKILLNFFNFVLVSFLFVLETNLIQSENTNEVSDTFTEQPISDTRLERAFKSTVMIFAADPSGQAGGGSGVVISPDGFAVTNFHVVQPCGPSMKCGMADGKLYDAVIVGLDPVGDLALIKLLGRNDFPFASLADSDKVKVGQVSYSMGNPFLLSLDLNPCVARGIVSGVHRYQFPSGSFLEYTDCIQTDAAVNPGNSGGPLFDESGEIIGINGRCSFEKRGRVNVGIGYAISSNQVRYFLGVLKSGRIVDHATMNAVVSIDNHGRVKFDDVREISDAYRAGLRYDDELIQFAGRVVDTANTFKNLVGIFPKGWRLPVTVRSNENERFKIFVRLGGLHSEAELIEMTEKMIEPPIVKPEFRKLLEEQEKKRKQDSQNENKKNPNDNKRNKNSDSISDSNSNLNSDSISDSNSDKNSDSNSNKNSDSNNDSNKDSNKGKSENSEIPDGFQEIEIEIDGKKVKVLQRKQFLSDAVKPYYEKKRGYANFYFNRTELARVLKKWRSTFDSNSKNTWNFSGKIHDRIETFNFTINDKGISYKLPIENGFWDADQMKKTDTFLMAATTFYQLPRGSGGLFSALYVLRQIALNDTIEEAEFVYQGTAPIEGKLDKLYDICIVEHWKVNNDIKFYFDPDSGEIAQIEMFADALESPCEILFRQIEDKREMEVRCGRATFGIFILDNNSTNIPFALKDNSTAANKNPAEIQLKGTGTLTANKVISDTLSKVVKIYGAGGLGGVHGYQSGIIISPEGHILTAITPSLQTDSITVVLDTGKKYEAVQVNGDPLMEIALLKIPASNLPFFEINSFDKSSVKSIADNVTNSNVTNSNVTNSDVTNSENSETSEVDNANNNNKNNDKNKESESESKSELKSESNINDQGQFDDTVKIGEPIYAVSNMFNIAEGNEAATVQSGVIAARTTLKARRGVFETPYRGEIFVVDVTTNNPGACGGALVSAKNGSLIGMLGKELMNSENNSWLNFAIPTFALRNKIRQLMENTATKSRLVDPELLKAKVELIPEDTIHQFQDWGILLVTSVSKRTPPFIDIIKPDSEAAKQGLQPDDLIVMINNQLTSSIKTVEEQIGQIEFGSFVTITIERKMTLIDVKFKCNRQRK